MSSTIRGNDGFDSATHQLGVNQTWQSVIASRARSTDYVNDTGRPIVVSILCYCRNVQQGTLVIDGVSVGYHRHDNATIWNFGQVSAIVPAGSTYRFNANATTDFVITGWVELR